MESSGSQILQGQGFKRLLEDITVGWVKTLQITILGKCTYR